ncbi:alpha/beta fold hydrolase [Georgenia soli]|uniref:alpha/beta fold hydrolase n=1 Tax=Georgenia soli TaxID=638953 RepID=UPI0014746332|nr:alpha/beta hydrolase [Georgenia soli]
MVLPGLEGPNVNPEGAARAFEVRRYRALAERCTVVVLRRRRGLPAGTSMADLAADHARALRQRFDAPVDVVGISTGGSVALQLAADHPDVVRRLVIWASACRLSDRGRAVQRAEAGHLRAGRHRLAQASSARAVAATSVGAAAMAALTWILSRRLPPVDVDDLVRTIESEDAFDATAHLARIGAPTLVVGGGRDAFYGAELFRRTAEGVRGARLLLLPRAGHGVTVSSRTARRAILSFLAAP